MRGILYFWSKVSGGWQPSFAVLAPPGHQCPRLLLSFSVVLSIAVYLQCHLMVQDGCWIPSSAFQVGSKEEGRGKCACSLTLSLLHKFPWAPTQYLSLLISHWPRLTARNSGTGSLLDGHIVPQKRITFCLHRNESRADK